MSNLNSTRGCISQLMSKDSKNSSFHIVSNLYEILSSEIDLHDMMEYISQLMDKDNPKNTPLQIAQHLFASIDIIKSGFYDKKLSNYETQLHDITNCKKNLGKCLIVASTLIHLTCSNPENYSIIQLIFFMKQFNAKLLRSFSSKN